MEYGVWNIIDVLSFHVSLESVSGWVPDRHPRDPRMTPFGDHLGGHGDGESSMS